MHDAQQLLLVLLESELNRYATWMSPMQPIVISQMPDPVNERLIKWTIIVKNAWLINPLVAIHMRSRFCNSLATIDSEISELSRYFEIKMASSPDAISFLLKNSWKQRHDEQLRVNHNLIKYLLYWTPVPPIIAINVLGAQHSLQPWILQYGIRALEFFPVTQAFFYIPQMVQALRYDNAGTFVII